MATAAEPRPAELPLPGGRERATVKLRPLLCGRMAGPPAWFLREEGRLAWRKALGWGVPRSEYREVPVVAYWVEHPGAGHVLVDTGFHPSVAVDPKQNLGRVALTTFKDVQMAPEQAVAAQLRERGVEPSEVGTVVMSHLHVDHASAMSEFPDATFVFSKQEWEAATDGGQLHGYVRRQFDHAFEYRTLDFEARDTDSYATFGRSLDLFGDGSVRVVFTPGHTLGHMSVILRLHDREALLTIDAASLLETLRSGRLPHRTADEHLFRRSLREIQLYERQNPDALIVAGKDLEQWRSLEAVYD